MAESPRTDSIADTIEGVDRIWRFPADLPEFCGPNELARTIEDYWSWEDEDAIGDEELARINASARGPLRGKSVQQLFDLAYAASFLKNEGKYTRCNLFAAGTHEPRPRMVVQFSAAVPLAGPETLRLLAPTLVSDEYALSILEVDGAISCDGVFLMTEGEGNVEVPDFSLRRSGGHHGLAVTILEPGEIAVREGIFSARLRANRLVTDTSMFFAPLVQQWLDECVACPYAKCGVQNVVALRFAPYQEIMWLWSRVISTARDLRHGGCFVILADPECDCIERKFAAMSVCLTDQLAEYWHACGNAIKLKDHDGFAAAVQECNRTRHVLFAAARILAALSATDGCVVLDRNLRLHGFGCVIRTSSCKGTRTPVDWQTGEVLSAEDVRRRGGTRHRSAFDLCARVPNTLAFVISQDGGVRVFSNDDEHVYLSEPLNAL